MRDYNMTDQEQVDMLKQWWNDYGKFLATALLIGILIGLGWRSWHQHNLNRTLQASSLYQQLLVADSRMDSGSVHQIASSIMSSYSNSSYATLTKLILAKEAIQNSHFVLGLTHLNWVIDHSKIASFRQIARLRAARVKLAEQQPQAALKFLTVIDDNNFIAEINAVKGDIYLAMGDTAKAKSTYSLAQQQFTANNIGDNIMQLKLTAP